jgi:hypothetical protein
MTYTKRHVASIMADGTVIIANDATADELRSAFTRLAQQHHRHLLAQCFDMRLSVEHNDELWGLYDATEDREGGR